MTDTTNTLLNGSAQHAPGSIVPGGLSRMALMRSVLMMMIAVGFVVPESEIRQKAFKANLVAKNLMRTSLHGSAHR